MAWVLGFLSNMGDYGRYWIRTSDPFRVKEVRYHCANRPQFSNVSQAFETRTPFNNTHLRTPLLNSGAFALR